MKKLNTNINNSGELNILPFNGYAFNKYSQNGEDGIIEEILNRLQVPEDKSWCVEFGAADGTHLSNSFALVEKYKFKAVYIESDDEKFMALLNTVKCNPSILPIKAFVSANPTDDLTLDRLLKKTAIPNDFALLSIDIDSNDLDVWESTIEYRPRVVVIEINSSVPPGILWRHSSKTPGNTFSATCSVARSKGYTLVCHTGNLVFVRDEDVHKLNLNERYIKFPELLFLFDSAWTKEGVFERREEFNLRAFAAGVLPKVIVTFLKRLKSIIFK